MQGVVLFNGKQNGKRGAFAFFAFHTNQSFVFFHYLFYNGQSNAGAFILIFAMQSLKNNKYFIDVRFIEPNAVIAYPNERIAAFCSGLGIQAPLVYQLAMNLYYGLYAFFRKLE